MTPLNENSPTLRKYIAAMRDKLTGAERRMLAASQTVIQFQAAVRQLRRDHPDMIDVFDYIEDLALDMHGDLAQAHGDVLFVSDVLTIHADGDSEEATRRMGIVRSKRPDNVARAQRRRRKKTDEDTQDLRRTQEAPAARDS